MPLRTKEDFVGIEKNWIRMYMGLNKNRKKNFPCTDVVLGRN